MGDFLVEVFLAAILFLYPVWRIFKRAGLASPLSLIILIPGLGAVVVWLILAFMSWPAARSGGLPQNQE